MADHEGRRLSLQSELGMTRRDLIRRGAVAGGTLLWAAPMIQSLRTPAYAQGMGQSPGTCATCYCWTGNADKTGITADLCTFDGPTGPQFNREACGDFCRDAGFQHSEYCSGATQGGCRCSTAGDGDATLTGTQCS